MHNFHRQAGHVTSIDMRSKVIKGSMTFGLSFWKKGYRIHILWCIFTGIRNNDPWVESHMWPQQTWGQRSSRASDLWFKFYFLILFFFFFLRKASLYPHTLTYFQRTYPRKANFLFLAKCLNVRSLKAW